MTIQHGDQHMFRLSVGLLVLTLVGKGPIVSPLRAAAWPHRAILTSLHGRPAAFRAYTLGGDLIIEVDASGRRTTTLAAIPSVRALTATDTIRGETPADFPLNLSKGPVVFVAEGSDSLHLVVGRNPYGNIDQVTAHGRKFTVRLVADRFVIDTR
jgi:hypothetical protein